MYGMDLEREMAQERTREYVAEAEERNLARLASANDPTLRARLARRLFVMAVAVERNATWDAVWEKMEAPKHP